MRRKFDHIGNLQLALRATSDVLMIVVIFFIMTSRFKSPFPIKIEPPTVVTSMGDIPDEYRATIYIGQGKVMFSLPDTIRKQALVRMSSKYHINFTNAELSKFRDISIIGVPIDSLKSYINTYYNNESFYHQPGIRIDSANNELANWINESRMVCKAVWDRDLHFYINADKREEYPQIKRIFDILESQGIHKWSLETWSKYEPVN